MENYKFEVRDYILENIDYWKGSEPEDLHHNLFNTNYYIIGRYKAKRWCKNNTFAIIETIKEYEQDNFGEVTTDFSEPVKVVNMFVYILGYEIMSDCNYWEVITNEKELTQSTINYMKEILKNYEELI